MRTVTFSDKAVAAIVKESFVAAWTDRGSGFHNEDYAKEQWIFERSGEAYATKNICTFFLTPDGRVFHYVAGYFDPGTFAAELKAVIAMRTAAFDDSMALKAQGMESLQKVHRDEAARFKARDHAVPTAPPEPYRGFEHKHSAACADVVRDGDLYLEKLHAHWSAVAALPALDDVRFNYLYGNSFTEEPRRGATRIGGRCCTDK